MVKSFYGKLASTNLLKNTKIYLPYCIMNIFVIAMFYIMHSVAYDEGLAVMSGGDSLKMILIFGIYVIGIFSAVTIFYTNSFIMKQRKKEIGVYNILGLGKWHIAKMMSLETLMITAGCLVIGLVTGIVFSKLMYILFLKLLGFAISFTLAVSVESIGMTALLFTGIFSATILLNLAHVHLSNPIELVKGSAVGEREPKTKGLMTLIGIVALCSGYYIAQMVQSPLQAIALFFVAVVLVMVGTYALFTSGSIALLKTLRNRKAFYYQSNNFVIVSGMLYRMKQNAVGLANIAILSTMVIISLTTTISLYAGLDDMLLNRYPSDAFVMANELDPSKIESIQAAFKQADSESKASITTLKESRYQMFLAHKKGNRYEPLAKEFYDESSHMITLMTLEEFKKSQTPFRSKSTVVTPLASDEVYVYTDQKAWSDPQIILGSKALKVKEAFEPNKIEAGQLSDLVQGCVVIVKDQATVESLYEMATGKKPEGVSYSLLVDLKGSESEKRAFAGLSQKKLKSVDDSLVLVSRSASKESFFMIYGGFLFLGLFLGALFLTATVLIMYYKQITEGLDDKMRFETMQKVGMTHYEIKRAIRSQTVMVFFLPLLVAVVHVGFAFNMINRLMAVFSFTNTGLFILCTSVVVAVFAIVYYGIYRATVKTYFKMVQWTV